MNTNTSRQPSYLEEDSPAIRGNTYMLAPDAALFSIPASQLNAKHLKSVPKTPRSRRLEGVLHKREMLHKREIELEKKEEIEMRTRMKFVNESRKTVAEQQRHPKSNIELKIVIAEPQMPESVASAAKSFLLASKAPKRMPSSLAEKKLVAKVEQTRVDVASGRYRLCEHVHQRVVIPGGPKPSWRRPGSTGSTGGVDVKKKTKEEELVKDVPESTTTILPEEEVPELPTLRMLVATSKACIYLESLRKAFAIKQYTHLYESDEHAINEIVRLQRWIRHQRLKQTFFGLLKSRRIVIKALIRYALRFQHRYKHRCASMVLKFFQICFEEAGFRMAMKIFCFRVVRTQRVMRTFLSCLRARRDILAKALDAKLASKSWEGLIDPKRERTANYICSVAPQLTLELLRKYRRPYIKARVVYRRCLRAGDLTPAFQILQKNTVRAFLGSSAAEKSEPPQYAGGQLKMPTFVMLSNDHLAEDFLALLDKYEKRAAAHARKLALEMEAQKQHEAMQEAVRKGKVHEFQLSQMQTRKTEEEPSDRFACAVTEIQNFDKWKRRAARQQNQKRVEREKEDRAVLLELAKLHEAMPKKIL